MKELDPTDLVRELNDRSDFRHREVAGVGGSANVGPDDTIAGDNCWCGRPTNHTWIGQEDGAPHPRYPS